MGDKAWRIAKTAIILYLISLPVGMIGAYFGSRIALDYCNWIKFASQIIIDWVGKIR